MKYRIIRQTNGIEGEERFELQGKRTFLSGLILGVWKDLYTSSRLGGAKAVANYHMDTDKRGKWVGEEVVWTSDEI